MDAGRNVGRPSLFQTLLTPSEKDGEYIVPSVNDLKDEAYSVLAAAADTTGNAMTISTYNILSNPDIHLKLKRELEEEFPDPDQRLDFVRLETLPYLVGLHVYI